MKGSAICPNKINVREMEHIKLFFVTILIWGTSFSYAQTLPVNIDFETGTLSNWQFYRGSVADSGVFTLTACPAINGLHTLMSGSGTDKYGLFPVVGDGHYSLRLGHDTSDDNADKARYTVHIPTGTVTYNLVYHYAVVMEYPVTHKAWQDPRVQIKAIDSASNQLVNCDSIGYIASSPLTAYGFKGILFGGDVIYLPWTTAGVNLQGMAGHTVYLDFIAGDCSEGGHFGYLYADMSATLFPTQVYVSCTALTDTLVGPGGYASYRWCDSATFGITYDTTQVAVVPSPTVATTYAIISTPYPGFGCPDTLYTQLIPCVPPSLGIMSTAGIHR